jgi:hypothetical protein
MLKDFNTPHPTHRDPFACCTDSYSTAQEARARCQLTLSGNQQTLANNLFNEKNHFDGEP